MGKKKKFALILRTPYQIAKVSGYFSHFISLNPFENVSFLKPCMSHIFPVQYSLSPLGRMCFISIIFSACALTVYLKQVILNICDVIHYNKVYKVTTQKKIYFFCNLISLRTPNSQPKASIFSLLHMFLSYHIALMNYECLWYLPLFHLDRNVSMVMLQK